MLEQSLLTPSKIPLIKHKRQLDLEDEFVKIDHELQVELSQKDLLLFPTPTKSRSKRREESKILNDSNVQQLLNVRESLSDTEKLFELPIARKLPIRNLIRKTGDDEHVYLIDLATLASNLSNQYMLQILAATLLDFVNSSKMQKTESTSCCDKYDIQVCYLDFVIKAITHGD